MPRRFYHNSPEHLLFHWFVGQTVLNLYLYSIFIINVTNISTKRSLMLMKMYVILAFLFHPQAGITHNTVMHLAIFHIFPLEVVCILEISKKVCRHFLNLWHFFNGLICGELQHSSDSFRFLEVEWLTLFSLKESLQYLTATSQWSCTALSTFWTGYVLSLLIEHPHNVASLKIVAWWNSRWHFHLTGEWLSLC